MFDGDLNPHTIANKVNGLGERWAELESAAEWLTETRKTVRAQHSLKAIKEAGSAAKAELIGEASPEYEAHLKAMVDARKLANIAKVNYETGKLWVELLRSQESTRRAEMQLR